MIHKATDKLLHEKEEELKKTIQSLQIENDQKKQNKIKRDLIIQNARKKYCQFQKPVFYGSMSNPLIGHHSFDNDNADQIVTQLNMKQQQKRNYSQQRKKTPDNEIHLKSLANQLDLKYLLLDNNYFTNLLNICTQFRKMLSIERNPPIDKVIDSGAVAHFVKILDIKNILQNVNIPSTDCHILEKLNDFVYFRSDLKPNISLNQIYNLQFEATWALTNIGSGSSAHTNFVVTSGAVPYLIELIKSSNKDLCEQAIWALGNIMGDCATMRNYVLNEGVMKVMIEDTWKIAKLHMSTSRNFTWTLSNGLRGKPIPDWELVKDSYPLLCELVYSLDEEVLTDCCWALSYMADMPEGLSLIANNKKLLEKLMELCQHVQPSICTPTLRTIGNVATGNEMETQALLDVGVLKVLDYCMTAPKKGIRKEAAWTISNITAGNLFQIRQVLDSECAWVFSNALSGGKIEDARRIVNDYDIIKGFSRCLSARKDVKVLTIALEGIENIFKAYAPLQDEGNEEYYALQEKMEENEIPDLLEQLQRHKDDNIYTLASNILTNYFVVEEEEEEVEENTKPKGGFTFGSGDGAFKF
ncbi:hypothetical protein ABK040_015564 [Willaertia magna]